MPAWTIAIPETPSPAYVLVKNISAKSSETTVKEFFLFCGKIEDFEMITDDDGEHMTALIHFEKDSAAKTASLLSNALIDDCHIVVAPYFKNAESSSTSTVPEEDTSENSTAQESKAKTRIIAEILANGYIVQDQIVAKGLEYDSKYSISSRLSGYFNTLTSNVKSIDQKYRIWDKAVEIDNKYKIQEKVQNAAQSAQETANTALLSPTGQKVQGFAQQTLAQIAAVHYEAKKIQTEKNTDTTTTPVTTSA